METASEDKEAIESDNADTGQSSKGPDGEKDSNEPSRGFHAAGGVPANYDPVVEDRKNE